MNYNTDNVFYDAFRNEIYVASVAKAFEFLKYKHIALKNPDIRPTGVDFYNGYEIIDLETGMVTTKMMQKDLMYGISSVIRNNGKVYFGTWTDNRIVMCDAV